MSSATLKSESVEVTLQFALLLVDGVTDSDSLLGTVTVNSGAIQGQQKESSGAYIFYKLNSGSQIFSVRSGADTPFYLPIDITVTIPMPSSIWPAFPDITQADPNLPLGDPGQKAAYRAQRILATLLPTVAYPFPGGATLVRGTVWHAGQPLADATVQQVGGSAPAYATSSDGQFVLFFQDVPGIPQVRTINVKHQSLADANVNATVTRGMTTTLRVDM